MTGMKEGAGEDPFADEGSPNEDPERQPDDSPETASTEADPSLEVGSSSTTEESSSGAEMSIPYKYRRDSVQDDRDRVPLFLHAETKTDERKAMRELEERFGDRISLTDLREALVKAGLENLDTTQKQLEQWGYGIKFD